MGEFLNEPIGTSANISGVIGIGGDTWETEKGEKIFELLGHGVNVEVFLILGTTEGA